MISSLQPFFERLHRLALTGMNAGGRAGTLNGSGERHFLAQLARYYSRDTAPVLVDAGAHAGDYTAAFLAAFQRHAAGRVLALEPATSLAAPLQQRLRAIRSPHRVDCLMLGLSDQPEARPLYRSGDDRRAGLASVYPRRLDHFQVSLDRRETIELQTLDQVAASQGLSHIHLLKLDIEGHELAALRGAQQLRDQDAIDFIQFEFGGCNIDSRTFWQDFYYLLSERYLLARLLPRGWRVLDRYREQDEIFLTTNYIAVHRRRHADFLRY